MAKYQEGAESITQGEHIGPNKTGDNIQAKRVALYGWDGANWQRQSLFASGLVPEKYDYISLSYTGDNITGIVYKTGGSGGTTVATLTLAYSGSNITSVTRT